MGNINDSIDALQVPAAAPVDPVKPGLGDDASKSKRFTPTPGRGKLNFYGIDDSRDK